MPLFDYIGPDGSVREVMHPNPAPDWLELEGVQYHRLAVQPFQFAGRRHLPTQGEEVMRGYYLEEQRLGARFRTRLPARVIKEAWADEVSA